MQPPSERDRLRGEALQSLRKAQLALRKIAEQDPDLTESQRATLENARVSIRNASEMTGRIQRTPVTMTNYFVQAEAAARMQPEEDR